jgi:hypothetical protein
MRHLDDDLHLIHCFQRGLIPVRVGQGLRQKVSEEKARKWMWVGLAVFVALQIYFVQEMLAALMLFTAVFAIFGIGALILYLIDTAGQWGLGWAGHRARPALDLARRGWTAAGALSKKPFHRPRSETAP